MSDDVDDRMVRWRDRPPGLDPLENRAARLVQTALPPDEPDGAVLERIARRLHRPERPPLATRTSFRLALAVIALVAGVASVRAFEWVRETTGVLRRPPPTAPARPPSVRRTRSSVPLATAARPSDESVAPADPAAPAVQPGIPAPAPVVQAPPARSPLVPRRHRLPAEPAPATIPDAPATGPWRGMAPSPAPARAVAPAQAASSEIAALDRAVALLRRDHDAAAALVSFDAYLSRYPHGFLYREALGGRVDALLMLGRSDEALSMLEGFPFDGHRRSTELEVIRAELRARRDCARAVEDFTAALGRAPDAALLERILYGRGSCCAKLGDKTGAAEDLRRYAERFPNAEHAAWARRWLQTNAPAKP